MSTQVSTGNVYLREGFVPRLENGDRLTREEFHRRYEAMPENIKAELVKGVVYMASPVSAAHGKAHAGIMGFLGLYQMSTRGIVSLDNSTYFASDDYEPQPDAVLRIDEKYGGKSWVNSEGYLEGAPELVVEIASSSVSYDLHDKLELYEQKGIQEYIVWRVLDEQIDWFRLVGGKYQKFEPDKNGIIESRVFPGLSLNVGAMLNDELQMVLNDLRSGMTTKEYIDFAESLTKQANPR